MLSKLRAKLLLKYLLFLAEARRQILDVSDLAEPELALDHARLFIYLFSSSAYLTCWYGPRGLWDFFFFSYSSYNGECRNHLYGNSLKKPRRIQGRQDNKHKLEEQRLLLFFLPHFRLFSGHHLFNYIVSPLLASTHVLPTHIKNETDRMLFLRPIYMLMKNASQFQKKANVCRRTGWIRTHPPCPGWKERRLATCPACHFPFPLSLTRP